MADRSLWTCAVCGRSFASRNQAHSCTKTTSDEHLHGKDRAAVELYRLFEELARSCGKFRVHATKTRIAYIARMTFGGASLGKGHIDVSFILPAWADNQRMRRVELYGPTSYAHSTRIRAASELDDQLAGWMREALRRGQQETLGPGGPATVRAADRVTVDRFVCPFASKLVEHGLGFAFAVPRHLVDALGPRPWPALSVLVSGRGVRVQGRLERSGNRVVLAVDEGELAPTGLGPGDSSDLTARIVL